LPPITVLASACGRTVRRSLPALAATAAVATLGAVGAAGYHFATHSPRFAITDIEIRGAHHLAPAAIAAAMPVRVGDNVFAANLGAIASDLRGNPWIASASLHRVLPHTLVVEVREREPVAAVELSAPASGGAGLYLVEADGHPFKRVETDAGDGDGLPVITGIARAAYAQDPDATAQTIRGALATLDAWGGNRPKIGEVHVDAHGALTLHTYDRATAIALGTAAPDHGDQIAERMATFDLAWAELDAGERERARAVHLGDRTHVTVSFSTPD
jgi:cell division protein FtsQ